MGRMVLALTVQVPQRRVRPVDVAIEQTAGRNGGPRGQPTCAAAAAINGTDRGQRRGQRRRRRPASTATITAKKKWGKWSVGNGGGNRDG